MQKSIVNLIIGCALIIVSASAQDNVVIVPMAGDSVSPTLANLVEGLTSADNVVTVAEQGGDFTDPVAAMASITATAANRYLLFIAPGVYTISETLVMKEYVDIIGSGQNATLLTGAVSSNTGDSTSALVQGADHASLRSLSIENLGGSSFSFGVYNDSAAPNLSDMNVTASGGNTNRGVSNVTSSPSMSDMNVTVSGGTTNYGVFNSSSSPRMSAVSVIVSGGSNAGYGVYNSSYSFPAMSDVTVTTSGAMFYNYGVYNGGTFVSAARIHNSEISATTYSIYAGTGSGSDETYISNSIIDGNIFGNPKCSLTFLTDGTELSSDCFEKPA